MNKFCSTICLLFLIIIFGSCSNEDNFEQSQQELKFIEEFTSTIKECLPDMEFSGSFVANKVVIKIDISKTPILHESLLYNFIEYNIGGSLKTEEVALIDTLVLFIKMGESPKENYTFTADKSQMEVLISKSNENLKFKNFISDVVLNKQYLELHILDNMMRNEKDSLLLEDFAEYKDIIDLFKATLRECTFKGNHYNDLFFLAVLLADYNTSKPLQLINKSFSECGLNKVSKDDIQNIYLEMGFNGKIEWNDYDSLNY
jgi:hypothetical protein